MTTDSETRVKEFLETCESVEQKNQMTILYNATVRTANAYKKEPTAVNLRNWDAAKKALRSELEECPPDAPAEPAPQTTFANKKRVFAWLQAQGRWQVSERTVYNHAKEGRLRPGKDGLYTLAAVKRYAKNHLVEIESGLKAGDNIEALQETKLKKEIEHRNEQIDKLKRQRELDEGKYFPTADLEMEVAARAAVLVTGLSYVVSTRAAEWVSLVDGDPAKAAALIETIWNQFTDRLNEYATTTEYQVVVAPGVEGAAGCEE